MATSIDAVTRATTIVHGGSATLEEYRRLLRALKGMKRFGLARRLLRRARQEMSVPTDSAARLYLGQQRALCTNKDLDSRAARKREQARRVREDVIATMVNRTAQSPELLQSWRVQVTIGEAYFGLAQLEQSVQTVDCRTVAQKTLSSGEAPATSATHP